MKSKTRNANEKNNKNIQEEAAVAFIRRMQKYYEEDLQNPKEGAQIVVHKIEHIDEIVEQALNLDFQEILLSKGLLFEIKRWLEPLPDKSLPNIKIKRSLLDLLMNIQNITVKNLSDSEIGKIVYFYSKNAKEIRDVRDLAVGLVNKWKNLIIKEETE